MNFEELLKQTWVVIPAYNESKRIEETIKRTSNITDHIIVVDDGSTDDTYNLAKSTGVTVLRSVINLGKGSAARIGCEYAIFKKAKKIVLIDGDGQHVPEEIPHVLVALCNHDIAFTYRTKKAQMPFIKKIGNRSISLMTYILFGIKLKDTQCGFRAFTKEAYKKIKWSSNDYSMESEIIVRVAKNKLKYVETPIKTIYHEAYKGQDPLLGLKVGLDLLKWKVTR